MLDEADRPDLGTTFPAGDQAVIAERITTILRESAPYRLDTAALADLGFVDAERADLVAMLVANGDLTEELAVPHDRLDFFGSARNAVGFALPGLEDYATDVFFLLHAVAAELSAGITEITAALDRARRSCSAPRCSRCCRTRRASRPRRSRRSAVALAGSGTQALELFVAPGPRRRRRRRRVRRPAGPDRSALPRRVPPAAPVRPARREAVARRHRDRRRLRRPGPRRQVPGAR